MQLVDKLLGLFHRKDMYHDATYAGKDCEHNYWYVPTWFRDLFSEGKGIYKNEFDLTTLTGKRDALRYCTPFSTVVDRCAKMMQTGRIYVTDKNDNERPRFSDITSLLQHPNPMQNGKSFLYQVETCLRAYGFCPIYFLRVGTETPTAMSVIPPYWFHLVSTGKIFSQTDINKMVKEAYIQYADKTMPLLPNEYCVIYNSEPVYPTEKNGEITFTSPIDGLSMYCRNYMSAMIARGNLIVNGGPKGILYGNDNSETGNAMLTPRETDELNERFKSRFGLVKKAYQIMVTNKKVGYIPLGQNTQQLMLHEEGENCEVSIYNAVGAQPDLFAQGSTYDNKEAAKRATYQDLIIPDALNIAEVLTNHICPDGVFVKIDFSDVPCLQEDRSKYADNLNKVASSITTMLRAGVITLDEARIEVAKYLDINPQTPLGELQRIEDNANVQTTSEEE